MRFKVFLSMLVVFAFCYAIDVEAQGRQARVSRSAVAQVDAVQKELELSDEQTSDLGEMRGQRGQRGQRGGERGQRGEGDKKGERGQRGEGDKKGERGNRGGSDKKGERGQRGDRSDRARGGQSLEQVQAEIDRLAEVLLPHQMTRLNEIYVQVMGQRAIQDPVIADELEITDEQKSEMEDVQTESREQMRGLRDMEDRSQIREKFTEISEQANEKVMAILTKAQKKKLKTMAGDAFEMPEDAFRRGRQRGRERGRTDF